jgi:hypothetical protein
LILFASFSFEEGIMQRCRWCGSDYDYGPEGFCSNKCFHEAAAHGIGYDAPGSPATPLTAEEQANSNFRWGVGSLVVGSVVLVLGLIYGAPGKLIFLAVFGIVLGVWMTWNHGR